jgi:hypothetical protein
MSDQGLAWDACMDAHKCIHKSGMAGVGITARELAKCKGNAGLASKNKNQLASLANGLFFSLSLILPPLIPSCFLIW